MGKKIANYIHPMLARLHDKAFDSPDWIYEIKWDGYRAIANIKKKLFYSRNGLSFKDKYAVIYNELNKLDVDIVLDGEIVALDKKGMPSFQHLQQYEQNDNVLLIYYVFDCLYVNGKSIEKKTLLERKKLLKEHLPKNDLIQYCDHVAGRGKDFFKEVKKKGLEGMIAKRADSKYYEGKRSSDWLKVKHVLEDEAIIAGYTAPRGNRKYFGSLIIANYKGKKLHYIGHIGTGFDEKTLENLYDKLHPLIIKHSPFDEDIKSNSPVTWVKPELVCNVKYTEVTNEGLLRHPVFLGLRMDKAAKDVKEGADLIANAGTK